MAYENPVRFTLNDETLVIVRKVADEKYDFELILSNGSRKTFLWRQDSSTDFANRQGADILSSEAVKKFVLTL